MDPRRTDRFSVHQKTRCTMNPGDLAAFSPVWIASTNGLLWSPVSLTGGDGAVLNKRFVGKLYPGVAVLVLAVTDNAAVVMTQIALVLHPGLGVVWTYATELKRVTLPSAVAH